MQWLSLQFIITLGVFVAAAVMMSVVCPFFIYYIHNYTYIIKPYDRPAALPIPLKVMFKFIFSKCVN